MGVFLATAAYGYQPPVSTAIPIVTNGLVLWTSCDSFASQSWTDKSGNGNNGIVSGSVMTQSGSFGLTFNGTNNFITFPTSLVGQPSSSFTLQYYGSMYNDGVLRDLWCKDDFLNGWDSLWQPALNRFVYRDQSGQDFLPGYTYPTATKVLVTFVLNDTANTEKLYINGALQASGTKTINAFNAYASPLKFGWNNNGDGTYFKGAISDLVVYNTELSLSDVQTNYNALFSRSCSVP